MAGTLPPSARWRLLERLGAVPRVMVWDGEAAIGRWRGGRVELTEGCHAFRGTLGVKVLVCKPADPEAKGLVERAHDYLERRSRSHHRSAERNRRT